MVGSLVASSTCEMELLTVTVGCSPHLTLVPPFYLSVSGVFLAFCPTWLQALFPSWKGLLPSGIFQTAASSKPVMVLDQPQKSILRGKGSPRMAGLAEGGGQERRSFPLVYWNEQSWEMR